jgi:NitT/TauT family transport system permease protein
MKQLFELRGELNKKTKLSIEVLGALLILSIWQIVAMYIGSVAKLPSPVQIVLAFPELQSEDYLIGNALYSIGLNYLGYIEAILVAVPIGFLIGCFPLFGALSGRYINALRFLPLTAVTGLFIMWFGIETNMKVQFLAFGILVYLLPVVVERVTKVDLIYEQTAYTLGASKWQIIRKVFFPDVSAKLSDDIKILVAISWTYIIVAELVNKSGGIGAMIFTAARQSRLDKVFAILILIIFIGFVQDRLFTSLDKKAYKYKYV